MLQSSANAKNCSSWRLKEVSDILQCWRTQGTSWAYDLCPLYALTEVCFTISFDFQMREIVCLTGDKRLWCTQWALCCFALQFVSSLGADALLWPKSLPGLFLVLVSFLNALSLNSAVFDMSNEHTFPKLGWDVKFPGFCLSDQTWSLSSVFSPRYRLKWRPFLSIISEVISPIFKILTKTVIHLLVVNF